MNAVVLDMSMWDLRALKCFMQLGQSKEKQSVDGMAMAVFKLCFE
jgi:hypothetical protein